MADLASLRIAVDTKPVKAATDALAVLAKAASDTEKAVKRLVSVKFDAAFVQQIAAINNAISISAIKAQQEAIKLELAQRRLASTTEREAKKAADALVREQEKAAKAVSTAAKVAEREQVRAAKEIERANVKAANEVERAAKKLSAEQAKAAKEAESAMKSAVREQEKVAREQERAARAAIAEEKRLQREQEKMVRGYEKSREAGWKALRMLGKETLANIKANENLVQVFANLSAQIEKVRAGRLAAQFVELGRQGSAALDQIRIQDRLTKGLQDAGRAAEETKRKLSEMAAQAAKAKLDSGFAALGAQGRENFERLEQNRRLIEGMGQASRRAAQDVNEFTEAQRRNRNAIEEAKSSISNLRNTIAVLGIGAATAALIRYTDQYTKFQAQLKIVTKDSKEFAQANADIERIAKSSFQSLEATGVLYARITNATRDLGATQKQNADITEAFALSLRVSGATAQESRSAIIQFSQAMAAGALRGEEFNSVNEAAPRFMRLLADSLNVPVGLLRSMAANGELTADKLANSLIPALGQLKAEAANIRTISASFQNLENSVVKAAGEFDKATGFTKNLTAAIDFLANNIKFVAAAVASLIANFAALKLAKIISEMGGLAVAARTVATGFSGPLGIAAGIAFATAAILKFGQSSTSELDKVIERQRELNKLNNQDFKTSGQQQQQQEIKAKKSEISSLQKQLQTKLAELSNVDLQRRNVSVPVDSLEKQSSKLREEIRLATVGIAEQQMALYDLGKEAKLLEPTLLNLSKTQNRIGEIQEELLTKEQQTAIRIRETNAAYDERVLALQSQFDAARKAGAAGDESVANKNLAMLIGETNRQRAESIKRINEESAATKAKAREDNQSLKFFTNATEAINQRIANLKEERDTVNGITEIERFRNRILEGSRKEYMALNAAQKQTIKDLLDETLAIEQQLKVREFLDKQFEANKQALDELNQAQMQATMSSRDFAIAMEVQKGVSRDVAGAVVDQRMALDGLSQTYETLRSAQADTAAIDAQNKELERQLATLFGGVGALEEYRAAELRAQAAVLETNAAFIERNAVGKENEKVLLEQAAAIRLQADELSRQAGRRERTAELQKQITFGEKLKDILTQSGQAFANSLFDGTRKGRSIIKDFTDFIKNTFKNLVVQFVAQPVVRGIAGSIAGALGFSGGANAAGTAGGAANNLQNLTGLAGIAQSITGGVVGTLGSISTAFGNIGFQSGQSFLAGVSNSLQGGVGTFASAGAGSTAFQIGQFAGKALPFLPGVFSLLEGNFVKAATQTAGTAIGLAIGGPIGGAIGSFIGGLFGNSGPKAISTQAVTTLAGGTAVGRPGKAGAIDGSLEGLGTINQRFLQQLDGLLRAAKVGNVGDVQVASELSLFDKRRRGGFNFQVKRGDQDIVTGANDTFGNNVEEIATALAEELLGPALRDAFIAIAGASLTPAIRDFLSAVETPEEISQRIALVNQLTESQDILNDKFGFTTEQILELVNAGANVDAVLNSLNQLVSPFEVLEQNSARLFESFQNLGLVVPLSAEMLRDMIRDIDKTTPAGRELAASLANLAPAFLQLKQAVSQAIAQIDQQLGELYAVVVTQAESAAQAAFAVREELQINVTEAQNSLLEIVQSERDALAQRRDVAKDFLRLALADQQELVQDAARRLLEQASADVEQAQSVVDNILSNATNGIDAARNALKALVDQQIAAESAAKEVLRGVLESQVEAANAAKEVLRGVLESQVEAANAAKEVLRGVLESQLAQVSAAQNALQQAARERLSTLQETANQFKGLSNTLQDFQRSLRGDIANTAQDSLPFARAQFQDVSRRAALGDADAMALLPAVGRVLQEASSTNAVNRDEFLRDLLTINAATERAASIANRQVSIAEEEIVAIDQQIAGLLEINESVLSVDQAIKQLQTAEAAAESAKAIAERFGLLSEQTISLTDAVSALETAEAAAESAKAIAERFGLLSEQTISLTDAVSALETAEAAAESAKAIAERFGLLSEQTISLTDAVSALETAEAAADNARQIANQFNLLGNQTIDLTDAVKNLQDAEAAKAEFDRVVEASGMTTASINGQTVTLSEALAKLQTAKDAQSAAVALAESVGVSIKESSANSTAALTSELQSQKNALTALESKLSPLGILDEVNSGIFSVESAIEELELVNSLEAALEAQIQKLGFTLEEPLTTVADAINALSSAQERLDAFDERLSELNVTLPVLQSIDDRVDSVLDNLAVAIDIQSQANELLTNAGLLKQDTSTILDGIRALLEDRSRLAALVPTENPAISTIAQKFVDDFFAAGGQRGTSSNAVDVSNLSDSAKQIAEIYRRELGRSIDATGLAYFEQLLRSGQSTIFQIAADIANSVEAQVRQNFGVAGQNQFLQQVSSGIGSLTNIQAFANGGTFGGGLRLVGENGPELEVTGPSRIFNAQQTASMLSGGGNDELKQEVRQMRQDLNNALFTIAKNTGKTADQLRRWDGDGLPEERIVA